MLIWLQLMYLLLSPSLLYGHGDLQVLIDQLSQKIEVSPNNPELLLERANFLRQHDEFERALQDLARVEKLAPQLPEREYMLAKIYMAQNNWALARSALDAYIAVNGMDSEPYALRSRVLLHLGELSLAEQDALQAIKLHTRAPLDLHLAYIELLLKRDDMDAALAAYAHAEESLGSLPVLLMSKARLFREHKRYAEASATYAQLRGLQPMLAFSCWSEEAAMWSNQDQQKAAEAVKQARQAWAGLPQRQRETMRDRYTELLNQDRQEL